MKYDEAKRLADEADRKFFTSSEELTMHENMVRNAVSRHQQNHFDEVLDALKQCVEMLECEHPEDQPDKYYQCIPFGKEVIAQCDEVAM